MGSCNAICISSVSQRPRMSLMYKPSQRNPETSVPLPLARYDHRTETPYAVGRHTRSIAISEFKAGSCFFADVDALAFSGF